MVIPRFEEILKPTLINMWLLGIPIEQGCPLRPQFVLYFLNLTLTILEEILFLLSKMDSEHFLEVTALVPCVSIGILCAFKALSIALKRKQIHKMLKSLRLLHLENLNQDLKIRDVEDNLKLVLFLTKYFFILNQILTWVYNLIPLVIMGYQYYKDGETPLLLPFDVVLPFSCDTLKPWLGVYIHLIISSVMTVVYLTAVDTLYCVLTTHICVNLAVISHKLARLTRETSGNLVEIVKRHQYLIELAHDLEEIFSPSLLLNFLASSIEICTTCFNIVAGDLAHLPPFLMFLASALVQIFQLSMFGDLLITESQRVGHSAYLCEWSEMDEGAKKTLLIIRERSRRPEKLTAMKFIPISYASFTKIISTASSYFTILNTVYSPPAPQ